MAKRPCRNLITSIIGTLLQAMLWETINQSVRVAETTLLTFQMRGNQTCFMFGIVRNLAFSVFLGVFLIVWYKASILCTLWNTVSLNAPPLYLHTVHKEEPDITNGHQSQNVISKTVRQEFKPGLIGVACTVLVRQWHQANLAALRLSYKRR